MRLVADVLERDPRGSRLANNGQARIGSDWEETREELGSFVCEGRYADGITRIVENFVRDLNNSSQQAAWVSGFFGSGKSHLLKMLAALWENQPLGDGLKPAQIVAHLPEPVKIALRELETEGVRSGGLFAAAGTLLEGQGKRPRYTVLAILLKAVGLPADYDRARFVLYLRDKGIEQAVEAFISENGSTLATEVEDLFVSSLVAEALARENHTLGSTIKDIRETIKANFRTSPDLDITRDQFTKVAEAALRSRGKDGKIPLTLLALDEVQIFIGEDGDRAGAIAEIAETFAKGFDRRVMLVGAGQSALTSTAHLRRIVDRFTIRVQLDDNDVEQVTRQVLLRKKAVARPALETILDTNSAAVSRQLRTTKIEERGEDRAVRVDDYPLLPVRRRFWDACFRALDKEGTQAQLRSQLRILHDALSEIAAKPLGHAVPADALYEALKGALVQSGELPRDAYERIEKLNGQYDGRGGLAAKIAAISFLISRLPRENGVDIGVRATAHHIADLLIDDLTADQGALRSRIEGLIKDMVAKGDLMQIGEEVRIQTTEGRAWEEEFRRLRGGYSNDPASITAERDRSLTDEIDRTVRQVRQTHGVAAVPRRLVPHFGDDTPKGDERNLALWIRNGWSISEKDFRDRARELGNADGTIHLHIAKPSNDDLRGAIVDMLASRQTILNRGVVAGSSAQEALKSMETRQLIARERIAELVTQLVEGAVVLVSGGAATKSASLRDKLEEAADVVRKRLFTRFGDADHASSNWEKALKAAKDGSDNPFAAVAHVGDIEQHPVCRSIMDKVGAGRTGSDLRKEFERAPYGWPQDAINAALASLVRAGKLKATLNGEPASAGALDAPAIGRASFQKEAVAVSPQERIALRGLLSKLVKITDQNDLGPPAREFLRELRQLGEKAGGDAPLPAAPRLTLEDEAQAISGNALLKLLHDRRTEIEGAITAWKDRVVLIAKRMEVWRIAERLGSHCEKIPEAATALIEINGIRAGRLLLEPQDPTVEPIRQMRAILVQRLQAAHRQLSTTVREALDHLNGQTEFGGLELIQKENILREVELVHPAAPSTDDDQALANALDHRPLHAWLDALDAVPARSARAAEKAARLSEPTVQPAYVERGRVVRSPADIDAWLDEQRGKLLKAIERGPIIIN